MSDELTADEYRALVGTADDGRTEMSAAEYRALIDGVPDAVPPRKSKYGNVKTEIDGHVFDSIAEARHYETLRRLRDAGAIEDLVLQPRYPIVINGVKVCTYVADFSYYDTVAAKRRVVDVKGMKTAMYRLKKKLMLACLGIVVEEVR